MKTETTAINIDRGKGDFSYPEAHVRDAGAGLERADCSLHLGRQRGPGLGARVPPPRLENISGKTAPNALGEQGSRSHRFRQNPLLSLPGTETKRSWEEVPDDIKRTFERLGIPEQERKFLAGVEAQFDSEAVYSNIKKAVGEQGVIFVGSTEGLKNYPEIFRKWFSKVIPVGDNKFSALNSAVFSGGSFIYVPPGVKVKHPLQAYFRINAENFGQFERTLIIADEGLGSDLHGRLHSAEI